MITGGYLRFIFLLMTYLSADSFKKMFLFPTFYQVQWLWTVFQSPIDTLRSAKPESLIWMKHLYNCR